MKTKSVQTYKSNSLTISNWLDVLAIAAWGMLLLKYWLTDKLIYLIHPNYFILSNLTAFILLLAAGLKAWQIFQKRSATSSNVQHISTFSPRLGSGILLLTALLGFLIVPRPLTSEYTTPKEIADFTALSRIKIQAFRSSTLPEERNLVDWVRMLNAYPEPDTFAGQKAKVQGFVIHLNTLPDNILVLARFVITHCALDAAPAGLPIKLPQSRQAYPTNTWLEIEGQMITLELEGKRELAIQAKFIKPIPEPKNPYEY